MLTKKVLYNDSAGGLPELSLEVVNKLASSKLSMDMYLILSTLLSRRFEQFERYQELFPISSETYQYLLREGFIDTDDIKLWSIYSIHITEKALELFKVQDAAVDSWTEEWRELWPKGVTSGGYPVRADLPSIKRKMKAFIKKYNYDKETIFQTTKQYLEDKRLQNYSYIKTAA